MKETGSKNGINRGHYFELLDRTHIASSYVQMSLGGHPVMASHPELMALYEEALAHARRMRDADSAALLEDILGEEMAHVRELDGRLDGQAGDG